MCGISGFIDTNQRSSEEILSKMTDALVHRGPDDKGLLFQNTPSSQVGLGHRRLSILDISNHGHQPMSFDGLSLVYNGEIYNFKEIKQELIEKGYEFDSGSDTEVLLKGHHLWGKDVVHKLNGMFAFALLDQKKKTLSLVRDRAGVKPLYWSSQNGTLLFASELKSFHQHPAFEKDVNTDALALYFQFGYIPQPHCIFRNTYKQSPGTILTFDLEAQLLNEERYWDVFDCYSQEKMNISDEEAVVEVEKILKSACEYRMVSDMPVGMFLSGGYDSSLVTAMLQSNRAEKVKTFTIGFYENKYNEAHHAKKIADYLGTDHTEYYCTQKDALEILPRLPEIWDEPFGDASAIPTTLVSQLAKKHVSVSLSSDGGDELFAGYRKHAALKKKIETFNKLPRVGQQIVRPFLKSPSIGRFAEGLGVANARSRLGRFSQMLGATPAEMMSIESSIFSPLEVLKLVNNPPSQLETQFQRNTEGHWLDRLLAADYATYQADDILTKVDRATMSCSLEGREPLLDYRLIEFVARLKPDLKIRDGVQKYLLKEITHKYIPKELMERPKMGFGIPIFEWLKDEMREFVMLYLGDEKLDMNPYLNSQAVRELRDSYLNGNRANTRKIWLILMFEMWRERWL